MKFAAAYLIFAVVFLIMDLVWLGYVARDFYREQLGALMTDNVNIGAAVAFYLLYVLGVMIFVVAPALEAGGWTKALMMGALFGFFAYATYDLTNLAVMKNFPATMAYVDMAWGAAVTGISAAVTVAITNYIFD